MLTSSKQVKDLLETLEAEAYQAEQDAADKFRRREARQAGKAQTRQWARTVDITVKPLPRDVRKQARLHYRHWANETGMIAFIRHRFTNYEALIAEAQRRHGADEAHDILQARCDAAASTALARSEGRTPQAADSQALRKLGASMAP